MAGVPARTYLARCNAFTVQRACDSGIGAAGFPQCPDAVHDRLLAFVVAVWLAALATARGGFSASTWESTPQIPVTYGQNRIAPVRTLDKKIRLRTIFTSRSAQGQ